MKNLTISVDERVARWARVAAAERDMSVSRFIASLLEENMERQQVYEVAMHRSLARRARRLKGTADRYPSRDELHE